MLKSLNEMLEETETALIIAEEQNKRVPCVKHALALYWAVQKYDETRDLLDSILIEEPEEKPLLNKRKRNRNRRISKNNQQTE
jgi:hypothetical protein